MNLLTLELRRNFTRRATRLVLLGAAIAIAVNGVVQFATHEATPPPAQAPSAPAESRSLAQCITADDPFSVPYESGGYSFSGPQFPTEPNTQERREICDRFDFGIGFNQPRDPRFRVESLRAGLLGFSVPLIMLALILGATYVGAEWRANTVATQLVWETRRVRVGVAKLAAAIITALLVFVLLEALAVLSVLPAILLRGTTTVPEGWWSETAALLLRAGGLVAMAAAVGHSLGSLGRNTSAAVGASFVYLMILEGGLIGSLFPGSRRWLIVGNAIVWMNGQDGEIAGRSMTAAGMILFGYAAALAALSLVVFRTRDVS